MTSTMMGNIILIIVGAFMLFMVIYGMKKGLVRMLLSFGSIFIVLILVNFLNPIAKQALSSSPVYDGVYARVDEYVAGNIKDATKSATDTGVESQEKIIEDLPLPDSVKSSLNENNTKNSYAEMKVNSFADYLTKALTDMIIGALSFILLFIIIFILLKVLIRVMDLITKLPVIHAFNAAGGGLVGLIESVFIIWIACIVVTVFSTTDWGKMICDGIASNDVLSWIYDNNLIQKIITGIFTA